MSRESLTDIALELVDAGGPGELSLKAVAARAGVAAPSLYNHVAGLEQLRVLAVLRVMSQLTEVLATAAIGRSRDEAVAALLEAHRGFVRTHPNRYLLLEADPLSNEAFRAEGARQLKVIGQVLSGYGLEGSALIHAIRRLRVVAHGFASIEAAGGFGLAEDTDHTYAQLSDMLIVQLNSAAADKEN